MTVDDLAKMSPNEVKDFIREKLLFPTGIEMSFRVDSENPLSHHKRFIMSGYETETGQCTVWNTSIVNEFAFLGIYDYTEYLFVDFYKGTGTIYLKYFCENDNLEYNMSGEGTTDIIYKIFELTIFSDKGTRRRI